MKTLYSEQDVQGTDYKKLMEYAVKTSDAFMLVYFSFGRRRKYSSTVKQIKKALKPYRIKERYDTQWPSTTSMDIDNTYVIEVYRSNVETLDILCEPRSLFSWLNPTFPEDIAFFHRNRCWFLTCAHEHFLRVFLRSQEDEEIVRPLLAKCEEETVRSSADLYCEEYDV